MAIADPKDYAVSKKTEAKEDGAGPDLQAQVAALTAQVQLLLTTQSQGGGITAAQLKEVMSEVVNAQAVAQAAALREIAERERREDINYPRISVYSYKEGDTLNPRPPLKCKMVWAGADVDHDVTTATELELLNLAEPGDYTFRRIGGTLEKLAIVGERSAGGQLTKLTFTFPTKEQRDTLPSMVSMLRDAFHVQTPEQLELDRLRAEVEALRAKALVAA